MQRAPWCAVRSCPRAAESIAVHFTVPDPRRKRGRQPRCALPAAGLSHARQLGGWAGARGCAPAGNVLLRARLSSRLPTSDTDRLLDIAWPLCVCVCVCVCVLYQIHFSGLCARDA